MFSVETAVNEYLLATIGADKTENYKPNIPILFFIKVWIQFANTALPAHVRARQLERVAGKQHSPRSGWAAGKTGSEAA